VDFRLLGPLEVRDDEGRELSVAAGRQRALLALLLLRPNEFVGTDRLVEELWGESAPATAHQMLLNQVSALRRALGGNGRLETRGSAYCLRLTDGERDVDRFEELLARARSCLEHDPGSAADALRAALALWRGPPLSDVTYESFAQTEIARLEERRLTAFEDRVDAELSLGRHAELVAELEGAVMEHPLRERLHAQLMLALYRCGRQAEALEAYTRARGTLVEEIGVEPGLELREMQSAVLAQDPRLEHSADEDALPPGLDGGSPLLAGRTEELATLEELLEGAADGRGAMAFVSGPHGIGKTRLAADVGRSALRARMPVLYAGAGMAPDEAMAAIRRAAALERPALLVLDDAGDLAPAALEAAAELGREAAARGLFVLVLHRGTDPPPAFAGLAAKRLRLGPLAKEAVAELAALYGAGPASVRALAVDSGGVPLAAHRAASRWAQSEAAERLVQTVARAETERSDMRAAQSELAVDVIGLHSARARGRLYTRDEELVDGAEAAVCPFLGLATFDAAHAEYFFGRERLVADLVARLVGSPLLAVVGPSGSGKSSALRAGLLPALAESALPGSARWRQVLIRPGERPLLELERAALPRTLDELRPGERLVLAVDQFEEIFTACRDENERAAFVDAVVEAARDGDGRVLVVLAMRADFYGRCAAYDGLAGLVGANQVLVGPMRGDELRRAIELPARRAGLRVEPGLVDVLVADVRDEPGGLPLLSTALRELWRERDGRVMRREAYERTGGVRGAVARLAESTYARMDEPQRLAARRTLLRLADAGDETAFVRRRVPRAELDPDRDAHAAAALERLTESRLVTVDEETVEVAHEALLREWPRLRSWLEEGAEGRRLHQHLIHAARDWQAEGRDPGALYRGARLASTLDWAARYHDELNELERAFLSESRAQAELEAERQRRTNRRLLGLLAGAALMLAVALVAGIVALEQRGSARREATAAEAQRLGAQALSEEALDRSLLLARQGIAFEDSLATRGNLLAALLRSPAAVAVLRGEGGRMLSVAVHPGGELVVAGDHTGRVLAFDGTGRRLGRSYRTGLPVRTLRFSPDGRRIAVASGHEGEGALDLLEADTLRRIAHRRFGQSAEAFRNIAFSPDSRVLAFGYAPFDFELGRPGPGSLERWGTRTGRPLGPPVRVTREADFLLGFAAGGRRIVTMSEVERQTVLRDAETLRPVRRLPAWGLTWASALSPDGRVLALAREDGSLRLVDLRTGSVRTPSGRHEASIQTSAFMSDGSAVLTGADDAKLILWDVRTAAPRVTFEGHAGRINGATLSPDGATAYSASLDGTVIAWDLAGTRRLGQPFAASPRRNVREATETGVTGEGSGGYNFGVSPGGDSIAVVQPEGFVDLIDARTLGLHGRIRVTEGEPASGAAFAPDGRTIAVTTGEGTLRFWDTRNLQPVSPVRRTEGLAGGLAWWSPRYSADGRWLATAGQDTFVRLWDARRHVMAQELSLNQLPRDMSFRPDGKVLAVPASWGPGEGSVLILSVPSLQRVARIRMPYGRFARFSPDGRLLLLGDHEGRAQLYDARTFEPVGRPLLGHAGFVLTGDFSPDGRTVATSSSDGTVRLWDAASSRPIGTPLPGVPNIQTGVAFVRGGSHIAAVYDNGQGYLWDVRPSSWARQACEVAGRALTRTEWGDVLPERAYAPACGG
jgi:WD40 repeat protein/DNA-binding SARP family transcriptional activator